MSSPEQFDDPNYDRDGELELIGESSGMSELDPALDARLFAAVASTRRFDAFAGDVAELLAIGLDDAFAALDRLDDASCWTRGFLPQMQLQHVARHPELPAAIAGFVRLGSGTVFPTHEHLGPESILILQGSCDDAGRILRPGERVYSAAGSVHGFLVRPGPDLLYLAIVEKGLRIGDRLFSATDPGL